MTTISIDPRSLLSAATREQKRELFVALAQELFDPSSPEPIPMNGEAGPGFIHLVTWKRAEPQRLELRDDNPVHQELKRRAAAITSENTLSIDEFLEDLNSDPESDSDL
jgi:hypothetical protein